MLLYLTLNSRDPLLPPRIHDLSVMHAGADQWQLRDAKLIPPVNTAPTHPGPTQHHESPPYPTQCSPLQCYRAGMVQRHQQHPRLHRDLSK